MAPVVVFVCALTSLACAGFLLRGWWATRARLLLWASIGFAGLATNNILLFVDRVVVPHVDLSLLRAGTALFGITALLIGCISDAE
jgi:hypothetical protein